MMHFTWSLEIIDFEIFCKFYADHSSDSCRPEGLLGWGVRRKWKRIDNWGWPLFLRASLQFWTCSDPIGPSLSALPNWIYLNQHQHLTGGDNRGAGRQAWRSLDWGRGSHHDFTITNICKLHHLSFVHCSVSNLRKYSIKFSPLS